MVVRDLKTTHEVACSPNLGGNTQANVLRGKGGCAASKEGAWVHEALLWAMQGDSWELRVRIREEINRDSVTVGVCYGLSDQKEGVDEASFKQREATSWLQAWILTGDFKCPDVCSSRNKQGGEQAIQSKCPGDIFLPEVPDRPTRAGLLLDTLLMGRKEPFGNVVADGSLGCSDHQWQSLNAEGKWERQVAEERSGLQDSRLWFIQGRQEVVLTWKGAQRRPLICKDKLLNTLEESSPMCKSQAGLAGG